MGCYLKNTFHTVIILKYFVANRNSKDSGIDTCVTPSEDRVHSGSRRDKRQSSLQDVNVNDHNSSRIQTVSEIVQEFELPGTPEMDFGFEHDSKTVR